MLEPFQWQQLTMYPAGLSPSGHTSQKGIKTPCPHKGSINAKLRVVVGRLYETMSDTEPGECFLT